MPKLRLNLEARPQLDPYLRRQARWACLVVHRRGGKTFVCVQDLIAKALTHKRPGPPLKYCYLAPTRDQAKDIAFGYLTEFSSMVPGTEINKADLMVTFRNGATIRLYSGESYERMRGLYFDGVILDEYADMDPQAWDKVIRPTLSDYRGWATFIGTPKGRNAFYRIHKRACSDEEWFSLVIKASESGIIPEDELEDLKRGMSLDAFAQEYECDFSVGVPGSIYAKLVEESISSKRVFDFPWDRSSPVWTSWDLGAPENTRTIYWQFVGREIHIIDHDTGLNYSPTERVAHMKAKGYPYAGHLFPHDAAAQEKTGKNFQQTMQEAGLEGIRIVPRCREVWPGINKAAELFPRMIFHRTNCEMLLESLEAYRKKDTKQEGYFTSDPVHDWSSHDADAFRMLAEGFLNGILKGHAEVIREYRPQHMRQPKARAGNYSRI